MTTPAHKPLLAACRERLTSIHRHDVERWAALWEGLGRASGLLDAGDRDGAVAELRRAEDVEHHLTGECEAVGTLLTALGVRDA